MNFTNIILETIPKYNELQLNQTIIPNEIFLANTYMSRIFIFAFISFIILLFYIHTKDKSLIGYIYFLNIFILVLSISYYIHTINKINTFVIMALVLLSIIVFLTIINLPFFIQKISKNILPR